MSLLAPQTKEEGKFQYCNYGYDKTKFKSFDDCMTNYNKVFFTPTTTDLKPINKFEVTCKDGTKDVSNGKNPPCTKNGGVMVNNQIVKQLKTLEQSQKEIDEQVAKIKFPLKTTLITSAVPLGLAYYSYYNNYSLTKGIGVVVIGSVVAFYGTIMFSGGKFV